MSSGSRQTVLSAAILVAAVAFTASARRAPAGQPPVHLAAPPVVEHAHIPADPHTLRVCADPNNLPFSNAREEGFENRLAELVARDLGRTVRYFWQPQRRGFIRTTLRAGECDVVMGVPASFELTRVTRPYYRSAFYFVSQRARGLHIRSLDDARLRHLQIGVELTGDDYDNPPAAQALANRHITDNVHGYLVYGDYSTDHPSWGLMEAVARGDVDVGIAWGPIAGYVARHQHLALEMAPVSPASDGPSLPFAFDISMGVRHDDKPLAEALDRIIARRQREIRAILASYGVPVESGKQGVQG
jgi:mxaJ protein